MKSILPRRNSVVGSAGLDEMIYSPKKYRETEGIKV